MRHHQPLITQDVIVFAEDTADEGPLRVAVHGHVPGGVGVRVEGHA